MLLVGLRGYFFLVEMWDKRSFLRGRSELNYARLEMGSYYEC